MHSPHSFFFILYFFSYLCGQMPRRKCKKIGMHSCTLTFFMIFFLHKNFQNCFTNNSLSSHCFFSFEFPFPHRSLLRDACGFKRNYSSDPLGLLAWLFPFPLRLLSTCMHRIASRSLVDCHCQSVSHSWLQSEKSWEPLEKQMKR